MSELRTHLSEREFFELLDEMIPRGYRMFGARAEGRLVAVAGVALFANFYYGRYMWVYDLITRADTRSQGYGKALMEHLEELARAEDCDTVALSSGVQRIDAHRFYEQHMGYERASYTFKKALK
ncbi:MAG: GNAT family N-acetyltransferase [Actinomycetota bacterium]